MRRINLYHLDNQWMTEETGSCVMDPHPAILDTADKVIECDALYCPINDGSMCNILAVQNGGKIGLMIADGCHQSSWLYRAEGELFLYDRVKIYANKDWASEVAYAELWEGTDRRVVKIDASKSDVKIKNAPRIPDDYLLGFGWCPFTFTPDMITRLDENEIFVFGSNKEGRHGGGAARVAAERFGAQYGVGVGRTGRCYAIPTMDGSLDLIREYVEGFRCYAYCHPELTFYVTRIGCGIAGWKDEQIAPLFQWGYRSLPNVILPREWVEINNYDPGA